MRTLVHSPRGLTLLELMAAIAVSTLLLSGAWRLVQNGIRSHQRGLQEVQMTQGTRSLLTIVTHDIQRAMATRLPYGIRGTSRQTAGQGTELSHGDHLEMLVLPPLPQNHAQDTPRRHGPQRIRYVFTPLRQGQEVALQRSTAAVGRDDSVERFRLVHEHIQEFSLRYFDGQRWRDEWQQPEVPQALEIAVSVRGGRQRARSYRFTTLVTAD